MKIEKKKQQHLVIAANILILAVLIVYIAFFTVNLRQTSEADEKSQLVSSMSTLKNEVTAYLGNSSRIAEDWANYINHQDWDLEETIENLRQMNADEDVMVQVLMLDTMQGVSTKSSEKNPDDYTVKYDGYYALNKMLSEFGNSEDGPKVCITNSFTNYINGILSIGFAVKVQVTGEDGKRADALLLRVEPLEKISENWSFGGSYGEAQLSMITRDGDYIFRAKMLKNENFYEFLKSYNDLTYPEIDQIHEMINEADASGLIEYKNSYGKDTLYAYSTKGYNDWIIIAALEKDQLESPEIHWSLLLVCAAAFILLLSINVLYQRRVSRTIKRSLREVEIANSAKTRFLSSMSHDIRTPMNAILGMTTVAEQNLDNPEHVEECLQKISLAGKHLLTLINDVLDISQIESGRFSLNPRNFSAAESAEDLVNIVYPLAIEKKLECDVYLTNIKQEMLYADKLRLNQIWLNLLSNAVKYTPAGGHIGIHLKEEDIPYEPDKVRLIFSVEDTGVGMSEKYLKQLFQPFSRENDSRTDKVSGSGLGMAITKQMVDLLGGTIQVKSQKGKGSTFSVTLTLQRGEQNLVTPTWSGKNAVLVGDKKITRTIAAYLRECEMNCTYAVDAGEVISQIHTMRKSGGDFQLVIMDRKMCDKKFLEIARQIRSQFKDSCPAILVSSYDGTDISSSEAADAGITGIIKRPVFASYLYQKLQSVLSDEDNVSAEEKSVGQAEDFSYEDIHILIAEDNDMNWEIIQELLSFHGITAERAVNGQNCVEMLEAAKAHTYSMIFMDIQMPVMNGYEAARAVRALEDPEKAQIPIIAMTADAFASDVSACAECGMNGHVAKPVDMNLVLAEVRKYGRKEQKNQH